eukprot:183170-Chlamydomonas_euryale.AAC.4
MCARSRVRPAGLQPNVFTPAIRRAACTARLLPAGRAVRCDAQCGVRRAAAGERGRRLKRPAGLAMAHAPWQQSVGVVTSLKGSTHPGPRIIPERCAESTGAAGWKAACVSAVCS